MDTKVVEQVAIKAAAGRLWFGFPHYVVLGWAAMVSWQIWELRNQFDGMVRTRSELIMQNKESLTALSAAVVELQASTRALREDAVRTRTILELKFPRTAERVDDAIKTED